MSPAPLVIEIAGGVRLALPPDLHNLSTAVFLEQEDWFEDEAAFVRALVRPGFRCLDVGACVGFYALTAAVGGGPVGRAWAFEPTPESAQLLRAGVAANRLANVAVLELGLGAVTGEAVIARHRFGECNRLVEAGDGPRVRVARLDDVALAEGIEGVDLVKLDVEGHEHLVIEGGREFFARELPLVMVEARVDTAFDWRAADALVALGYSVFRLVPGLGMLAPFRRDSPDPYLLNVFACKPDRAAALAAAGMLAHGHGQPVRMADDAVAGRLAAMPALQGTGARLHALLQGLAADHPQRTALAHAIAAADPGLDPERRYASLVTAVAAAREAAKMPSISNRLTAARIARDWGERGVAVELARGLLDDMLQAKAFALDAPFLPLLADYDSMKVGGGVVDWVNAMIVEAVWRWTKYAEWMGPLAAPANPAALLRRFGRELPEFERRRQVREILDGVQKGPLLHPVLATRRPGHRNPDWWNGVPVATVRA